MMAAVLGRKAQFLLEVESDTWLDLDFVTEHSVHNILPLYIYTYDV